MTPEEKRCYSQAAKYDDDVNNTPAEQRPARREQILAMSACNSVVRGFLLFFWEGSDPEGDPQWKIGDRIGDYELVKPCGQGGFGNVWVARKPGNDVDTLFALKLPRPRTMTPEAIRHEMEIQNRVRGHPNLLSIFEAFHFKGQPVLVTEYHAGGTVADLLRSHGPGCIPLDFALKLLVDLLRALVHTHGLGIVHGDVKPGNCLVAVDTLRLTDWGLAIVIANATRDGLAGTRAYLPPEAHTQAGAPTFAWDLWAFGVMAYLLIEGHLPFEERSYPYTAPPQMLFDTPEPVRKIVTRCLAENPLDRYPSAKVVLKAVEAARFRITPRSPSDRPPPASPWRARIIGVAMVLFVATVVRVGVAIAQHVPLKESAYAIPREPRVQPDAWDGRIRNAVVSTLNTAVANCQARWVGRGGGIDGDMALMFNVQPNGTVTDANTRADDGADANVQQCAVHYAQRIRFEPTGEAAVVSVSYQLMRPAMAPRPPRR